MSFFVLVEVYNGTKLGGEGAEGRRCDGLKVRGFKSVVKLCL